MANIIQMRRDTAANWTSADTVLAEGEVGFETDTRKLKVGDGSTAWTSLAYYEFGEYTSPTLTGTPIEDIYTWTSTTGAITDEMEPDNGSIQTLTLTGNITSLTDNFSSGQAITLMITDGGYTITWPTMTWVNNGGSAPDLSTPTFTVVSIWKVGSTLYGALVGDGS